jgi:CHAD domain-containing protein
LPRRTRAFQQRAASLSAGVGIKMPPVYLQADLSVGEAFQVIIDACLGHLAANRVMLAEPGIEAVHQMRVAVRRLRSACKLFEDVISDPRKAAALQDELRWLGHSLGRVRDWDVLLTHTLREVGANESAIRTAVQPRRTSDRRKLERDLKGRRYFALERGLKELAEDVASDTAHPKLGAEARGLLSTLDRRARKASRGLPKRDAEERHDFRKKLKKLHYGVGFLAPLYSPSSVARFRKRTTRLGDLLGDLNDGATAWRLLRDIGQERPSAIETWISDAGREKKLRRRWHRYRKAERFWK